MPCRYCATAREPECFLALAVELPQMLSCRERKQHQRGLTQHGPQPATVVLKVTETNNGKYLYKLENVQVHEYTRGELSSYLYNWAIE